MFQFRAAGACVLAVALSGGPALSIELGDPAPALKIAEWIKGQPVDLAAVKGKNIVVLEFWATWCGPCKASIPHLSEVQAKYRDKGVILVSVSDEPTSEVRQFVESAGDKMAFTVACDEGGATKDAYLSALGGGIPYVFIINKAGQVAWHGIPFDGSMERSIDAMLAGTYDLAAAKEDARKAVAARKAMKDYFETLVDGANPAKASTIGHQVVTNGAKDAFLMNDFSWTILTNPQIEDGKRDLALAMKAAKCAYDACEGSDPAIVDTYARALFDTGKRTEAIKFQEQAVNLCADAKLREQLQKTLDEYRAKMR